MFKELFWRELIINWRTPTLILQPLIFFILTIILFPLTISTENIFLIKISPAALWLSLLFSGLLSGERYFNNDKQQGILIQDLISLNDFWLLLLIKLIVAWLRSFLPILLFLPILALMLSINFYNLILFVIIITIGSIYLLIITMLAAALTLNESENNFLQFLIVVPLYIPIIIIGVITMNDVISGFNVNSHISLMASLTIFAAISIIPLTTVALKNQL